MATKRNVRTLIEVYKRNYEEYPQNGIGFINSCNRSEDTFVSYKEFFETAIRVLGRYQEAGIQKGNELVLQIQDNYKFLVCFTAAVMGGIIPIPIGVTNSEETYQKNIRIWNMLSEPYLIAEAVNSENNAFVQEVQKKENKVLFIEDALQSGIVGEIFEVVEDDIAFIQFSSGSTGDPKGVQLSHKNIIADIYAILERTGINNQSTMMAWMPLTHDLGLIGFHLMPSLVGINHYLMPTSLFIAHPVLWFQRINDYRVTDTTSPNFGYDYFVKNFKEEDATDWDLTCVKNIFNGAEPISEDVCNRFLEMMRPYGIRKETMCTAYGMAEATLAVAVPDTGEVYQTVVLDRTRMRLGEEIRECSPEDENAVSFIKLGRALSCCTIQISVDGQAVGDNIIGIVQVKGANVSNGYYKNKTESEKTFCNGWLNTGDLGFMQNGNLIITGRVKDVIFFNGQNLYAHDIERVCDQLEDPDVIQTVASGIYDEKLGREQIVLFVHSKVSLEQFPAIALRLRNHIMDKMGLMISAVVPVNNIPKTESGKIQRFQLVQMYQEQKVNDISVNVEPSEPETDQEVISDKMKLMKIWNRILGTDTVSVDETFICAGGNSIKIIQLLSEIYRQLQVEISISEFYEHSTINQLSDYINGKQKSSYPVIVSAKKKDKYLASSAQRRIYLLSQIDPQSLNYNVTSLYLIEGTIDDQRVQACFQQLVDRHDSLRTQFVYGDDQVYQIVLPKVDIQVENIHCRQTELKYHIEKTIKPFNLAEDPLLRVKVIHVSESLHVIVVDTHHIIVDGYSVEIMYREFLKLYQNEKLSPIKLQYKDYSEWENTNKESEHYQKALAYWKNQFEQEVPILDIYTDFPRTQIQQFAGKTIRKTLPKELQNKIKRISMSNDTTEYVVLLSVFYLLLYHYSAQNEFVVGTPVAGRKYRELEDIVGMFVNTLPIRCRVDSSMEFKHFLEMVRNTVIQAFEHQEVPFDKILAEVEYDRPIGRNPLFDVMFVLQNFEFETCLESSQLKSRYQEYTNNISKFDFTLSVIELNDGLTLALEYCTGLFKNETAQNILDSYINILYQVLERNDIRIGDIGILSELQRTEILEFSYGEKCDFDLNHTVIQLFDQSVKKHPDRIALNYHGVELTYHELDRHVNRVGNRILSYPLTQNAPIAVIDEASIDSIIALLAILKTGHAYVPIDPEYPMERVNYIIRDSKVELAFVRNKLAIDLEEERQIEIADAFENIIYDEELSDNGSACQLAYIIYTSGTTGKPKGVMMEHSSLANQLLGLHRMYDFQGRNHILMSPLTFDPSVQQILLPLTTGSTLYLIDKELKIEVADFIRFLVNHKIHVLNTVPSIINSIVNSEEELEQLHLEYLILAGEEFSVQLYQKIKQRLRVERVINIYGPTEACINTTLYECDTNRDYVRIPIGRPLINYKVLILNRDMQLVSIGMPGELYIGGPGLARGYVGREDLTKEKFVASPLNKNEILYRTGDMGRWLPDGSIEFMGRSDDQIKIRGMRIEPVEIQKQLESCEGVMEAVVLDYKDSNSNVFLCAYLVKKEETSIAVIKDCLRRKLPDYMVPTKMICLESFPLTEHGKLDRKRLPDPEQYADMDNYEAPGNEIENIVLKAWEEVLDITGIGVGNNFFELGGDSIKAIQVVAKLKKQGLELKTKDIFDSNSIRELASKIQSDQWEADDEPVQGDVILTPVHSWFFNRHGTKNHFNQAMILDCNSRIDVQNMTKALHAVIRHHDAFRLRCRQHENTIHEFYDEIEDSFAVVDEFWMGESSDTFVTETIQKLHTSLDLEKGPIIKAALIHDEAQDHFLIVAHHIAVDGVSWRILLEDILDAYQQAVNQKQIHLTEKTLSYQKWAERLAAYAREGISDEEIAYWDDINTRVGTNTDISVDRTIEARYYKDQAEVVSSLNRNNIRELLLEANRSYNTTTNDLLLTALVIAINRLTGQKSLSVTLEGHGREEISQEVDVSRTVGWFTSMYPVVLSVADGQDLGECILEVKKYLLGIPQKGIGYGLIKYLRGKEKQYQNQPPVSFNFLGELTPLSDKEFQYSELSVGRCVSDDFIQEYKLDINCLIKNGIFRISIGYNQLEYKQETIHRIATIYLDVLQELLDHCTAKAKKRKTYDSFTYREISENELQELYSRYNSKEVI